MQKKTVLFISLFTFFLFASIASKVNAIPTNIAQGADVTLNGTFFTNGWSGGDAYVNPATVVDGSFLGAGHRWDKGAVWWGKWHWSSYLEIDLGASYSIESFTVEADNNDWYRLEYLDDMDSTWKNAWSPLDPGSGWGLRTASIALGSSIITDTLRFSAIGGDGFNSVSEIQAFGEIAPAPVPEPSTIFLMLSGLAGLAFWKKSAREKS